jgi:transcriptional regulator with XRE-family HTH domain
MEEASGERRVVIATRLKERMEAVGLRQERLAELVGVKQSTVSRWLSGQDAPAGVRLQSLATTLETTADYLTGMMDEPAPRDQIAAEVAEALRTIMRQVARGEDPEAAFDEEMGEDADTLTPEDRRVLAGSPGVVREAINQAAGGDFASLSPERQLEVIHKLLAESGGE